MSLPISFSTRATTKEGVLRDLHSYTARQLSDQGMVPSQAGVTQPLTQTPVNSPSEMFDNLFSWFRSNKQVKGPSAVDGRNPSAGNTYRDRRYDFLSKEEGIRTAAYDDATGRRVVDPNQKRGNITVGVGFNMDRPDARNVWNAVFGNDVDFDKVYSGQSELNDDQVRRLFNFTAQEAETIVSNKFAGVDLEEHQRIALVSLAFNNPSLVGPNLTSQVRDGRWNEAIDEILHRSNRTKHKGLASRRYREAALFAGSTSANSALPDYGEYMQNYT